MADGENPDTEQETERVPCVFNWEQSDDGVEVKSVDIILGQSAGASNDIFEIYTEGTSVKEGSPLVIYPLERNKEVNKIAFQKELQLPKKTYQFLFVVEDIEGKKTFRVSDNYCCTTLVSGRTVNYIELDITDTTRGREKDGKSEK